MWRRGKDRKPPGPPLDEGQPGGVDPLPHPRSASYSGELLFALPGERRGTVDLDCMVFDPAVGSDLPLHVSARLPEDSIAGRLGAAALESWSLEGDPVDVELSLAGAHPKITLSCNGTRLMLHLPSN